MKKYNFRLFILISVVVLSALSTGAAIALRWHGFAAIGLAITAYVLFLLIRFLRRTVKDMQRLISSIRFNEFNVSFNNFGEKGLVPELIPEMESAIYNFNKRIRKLEAQQNFYEILLGRIDFAILVIDKTGKIEWINKAALDIFGKPQPRIVSELARVAPDLPDDLDQLIPRETRIIRFRQERQQVQMAATTLLFTLEGKALKLISLKNVESVIEESESIAWKKMIRILTHEIMNSLSPIISLSETFSQPDPETMEFMPKAMQTIRRRSKGLIDFVNNYQKLTRIPVPQKSSFLVGELLEDIRNLLKADNRLFSYSLENNDMSILADRAQIEQVMINLIKNACESSGSEMPAEVRVEVSKDNYQRTKIHITDNGQGILPEILDKIFVPFFTTKTSGSGIGLSICRQIINLHGGSISIESEPEKGTEVRLIL